MRSTVKENIMEHSEQTAQIAHALAIIANKLYSKNVNLLKVVEIAMYHEASEVLTGDLPTPIKYNNPEIKSAYKAIEAIALKKLLDMIPIEIKEEYRDILITDTSSYEYKLVKAADKLCAYIKCIEEMTSGNREFARAEVIIQRELDEYPLPEVKYFIDNFIDAFRKTLDELE
jgi:5'-deoxynucleotidase